MPSHVLVCCSIFSATCQASTLAALLVLGEGLLLVEPRLPPPPTLDLQASALGSKQVHLPVRSPPTAQSSTLSSTCRFLGYLLRDSYSEIYFCIAQFIHQLHECLQYNDHLNVYTKLMSRQLVILG